MIRVAITGISGYLGSFLVRKLLQEGVNVRVLVHRHKVDIDHDDLPGQVEWISGSMAQQEDLRRLVSDCQGAVHLAYSHLPGKYRGGEGNDPAEYWHTNFGSTIYLLEACRMQQVQRVVLLSSRAVFDGYQGQGAEPTISDLAIPRPTTHYGLLKYASEGLMDLYDDVEVCALRPTGIYGVRKPVEQSKWFNLVSKLSTSGNSLTDLSNKGQTEVHGKDVANAIHLLLDYAADQVAGRSFNCSDIEVSDRYLVQLIRTIRAGKTLDQCDIEPPEHGINVMNSVGLRRLGWSPGGIPLLLETIQQLIVHSSEH